MYTNQERVKVLTEQGLVIKGLGKVQRINCDAAEKKIVLRTWQVGRLIRRDFYLLSYKIFFAMRHPGLRNKVKARVEDLLEEASVLESLMRRFELPTPSASTSLDLILVSADCEQVLDALLTMDRSLAKMHACAMVEVADDNCGRMYRAYAQLKALILEKSLQTRDGM